MHMRKSSHNSANFSDQCYVIERGTSDFSDILSERIFFIIEGFGDIEELMIQHKTMSFLKKDICNLRNELRQVHDYLTWLDCRDDQPSPSDQRFFIEISTLADISDDILFDLTRDIRSTNVVDGIGNLAKRIQKSFQKLSSQTIYTFNTGGNINTGGQQTSGSIAVSCAPNIPLQTKKEARPKSYGHVLNRDIVGFKDEIEALLGYLMSNDKIQVVGIVGMGGSGKTTLAKHIYHHPDIKCHFDLKVWVCISQSWNKRDILCDMLRQTKGISSKDSEKMSDAEIYEDLSELFSSLSYLVVLDDIWDMNAWCDISSALPPSEGSKVIVTTRKTDIARSIDLAVVTLKPAPLNEAETYELFHRITFLNENPSHMLVKLGVEMVKKCRGLPLSITALAGILRMDLSENRWRRISETLMQKILNTAHSSQGIVKEVLLMSYSDLPHYLKPCVLYLGIFPEDCTVQAEHLMQMWIAECLIRCPQENKESKAEEYLEELIQRCIIQDVQVNYIGQVISFRIHDLIRQMFVDTDEKKGLLKDTHRISSCFTRVLEPEKSSHARSLVSIEHPNSRFPGVKLHIVFQNFMLLRVLILCPDSCILLLIPKEIGNLIHLRYLQLIGWVRVPLPSAFEKLQNLWTLNLQDIHGIILEPNVFWKMDDIKHLYLPEEYSIKENSGEAMNFDRLQKLNTLWNAEGGEWMLSEMPRLSPALQKLKITRIRSEEQLKAVLCTPSILSNNLRTLKLSWRNYGWTRRSDSRETTRLDDMNNLSKCESLHELFLEGMVQSRSLAFPPNLVKLKLSTTFLRRSDVMGIIGKCCPQLKVLILEQYAFVGSELVCNANCFQQLEELKLFGHDKLKLWAVERGAMPNLKLLFLQKCFNLELNPQGWEFVYQISKVIYEKRQLDGEPRFEKKLKLRRDIIVLAETPFFY